MSCPCGPTHVVRPGVPTPEACALRRGDEPLTDVWSIADFVERLGAHDVTVSRAGAGALLITVNIVPLDPPFGPTVTEALEYVRERVARATGLVVEVREREDR